MGLVKPPAAGIGIRGLQPFPGLDQCGFELCTAIGLEHTLTVRAQAEEDAGGTLRAVRRGFRGRGA